MHAHTRTHRMQMMALGRQTFVATERTHPSKFFRYWESPMDLIERGARVVGIHAEIQDLSEVRANDGNGMGC